MKRRAPWLGLCVTLAASTQTPDAAWVVLAYEVDLKARKRSLTRETFEQCVANFARYPKVPLVIEHADTRIMSGEQNVPAAWAEPHGYVTELRVGSFTRPDGRVVASLEGKLDPDAPTATELGTKWPWGSVTIFFEATDEESGEKLGALLFSFSLTAHPALKDLPAFGNRLAAGHYWGNVEGRDDLIEALRAIFELPALAPEADVLAALAKLEALLKQPDPESTGIDVDELVCALRSVLRLPALTTSAEVLAEVRKGLALPASDGQTQPTEQLSRGPAAQGREAAQESRMKINLLMLAAGLGLSVKDETEAREQLLPYAAEAPDVRKALNLATTAPVGEVVAALSKLATTAAEVPALKAKIETLSKAQEERDTADRKRYLDDLEAARPELKATRASLELHARTDWAGFQTAYPQPSREELSQRAQDGARTKSITTQAAQRAAEPGDINIDALNQAVHDLIQDHRDQGIELSYAEAVAMLEQG